MRIRRAAVLALGPYVAMPRRARRSERLTARGAANTQGERLHCARRSQPQGERVRCARRSVSATYRSVSSTHRGHHTSPCSYAARRSVSEPRTAAPGHCAVCLAASGQWAHRATGPLGLTRNRQAAYQRGRHQPPTRLPAPVVGPSGRVAGGAHVTAAHPWPRGHRQRVPGALETSRGGLVPGAPRRGNKEPKAAATAPLRPRVVQH
jgi:hypothetical protein